MGRAILEHLWYRREGPLARLLLVPLWLVSRVFGWVVQRRRRGAPRHAQRVSAKVISVGNLAVGGAGKTPIALLLARRFAAEGRAPAVLSRGYGRARPRAEVVVSDGRGALASVQDAGDEPLLLARACPGVPVLVGPDRAALARQAIERFGARTLVLDDGFQHLRLARDLDLVVLDGVDPFGNGHLLPRGPLREGPGALAIAGLVWITRVDQAEPEALARLVARVRGWTPAPIVQSAYRVTEILDAAGARLGSGALAGQRVLMLAGLARPGSFRRTLEGLGAEVVAEHLLADHGWVQPRDLARVRARAARLGLKAIAMTEKDAVRLPEACREGPLAVVRVEVAIRSGEQALTEALEAVWAR